MKNAAHRIDVILRAAFFCALFFGAASLSGHAAAQDGVSGPDNYLLEHRLKAGRQLFDSGDTSGRLRVEDSPSAKAARAKAAQLAAEKELAKEKAKEKEQTEEAQPAGLAQIPCQNLEDLLKVIVAQRRLGYLADAVDETGIVHMWFMSRERREWVSLTVDHDLTACVTAQGNSWHFALEQMQPE